jgi:hypothetical protein
MPCLLSCAGGTASDATVRRQGGDLAWATLQQLLHSDPDLLLRIHFITIAVR